MSANPEGGASGEPSPQKQPDVSKYLKVIKVLKTQKESAEKRVGALQAQLKAEQDAHADATSQLEGALRKALSGVEEMRAEKEELRRTVSPRRVGDTV